jgi:hypothetical protein
MAGKIWDACSGLVEGSILLRLLATCHCRRVAGASPHVEPGQAGACAVVTVLALGAVTPRFVCCVRSVRRINSGQGYQ